MDLSNVGMGALFVAIFMTMFSLANPILAASLLVGVTPGWSKAGRNRVATITAVGGLIGLITILLVGELLLQVFGITTEALTVAGGLLFIGGGYAMVNAPQQSSGAGQGPPGEILEDSLEEAKETEEQAAGAASNNPFQAAMMPLIVPLIVGPGTIAAFIPLASSLTDLTSWAVVIGAFVVFCFILWLFLRAGPALVNKLGPTVMAIISRLLGLVVLTIGILMLVGGISQLLPGLAN